MNERRDNKPEPHFGLPFAGGIIVTASEDFVRSLVAGEPFARHIEPEDMVAAARAAWEEVSADVGPTTAAVPPPLGIVPRWLWGEEHPRPTARDLHQRLYELRGAIGRYQEAGCAVPAEWWDEMEYLPRQWRDAERHEAMSPTADVKPDYVV